MPDACSSWFLPRIVGVQTALELVYGADILSAEEARTFGILRSLHAPDELLETAHSLARRFVDRRSPAALGLTKQLVYRGLEATAPRDAHVAESLAMLHVSAADGKEGVAAFLAKRTPHFTARASELPRIFPL